jgi:hypothetical protein
MLLLAACARSEDASVLAEDNDQARAVEHVRSSDENDAAVALGSWRPAIQGDDSNVLEFGPDGAPPIFSLRCDGRRGLYLQRHGAASTADLPMMLLTIGSETRRLPLAAVGGAVPMLRAAVMPQDPLIGLLGRNGLPMVVRIGDAGPLVLPAAQAVNSYVNNCANAIDSDDDIDINAAAPASTPVSAPADNAAAPAGNAQ